MSQKEFGDWMSFYRAYPFDDLHRYHRPAALIAKSMAGGDVDQYIDWLSPPVWQQELSSNDIKTLKAFGLTRG